MCVKLFVPLLRRLKLMILCNVSHSDMNVLLTLVQLTYLLTYLLTLVERQNRLEIYFKENMPMPGSSMVASFILLWSSETQEILID